MLKISSKKSSFQFCYLILLSALFLQAVLFDKLAYAPAQVRYSSVGVMAHSGAGYMPFYMRLWACLSRCITITICSQESGSRGIKYHKREKTTATYHHRIQQVILRRYVTLAPTGDAYGMFQRNSKEFIRTYNNKLQGLDNKRVFTY